ncbi:MAG: dihydroneopterin aldolase [Rhodospirillales bacterium]
MRDRPPFREIDRKINLKSFEIDVAIGIHDFERRAPQRLIIDVELSLEVPTIEIDDRIDNVVDYDFLRRSITALVADRHFNLQETLCQDIVRLCFAKPSVTAAWVRTCKPDVYPDCQGVSFEINAVRSAPSGKSADGRLLR